MSFVIYDLYIIFFVCVTMTLSVMCKLGFCFYLCSKCAFRCYQKKKNCHSRCLILISCSVMHVVESSPSPMAAGDTSEFHGFWVLFQNSVCCPWHFPCPCTMMYRWQNIVSIFLVSSNNLISRQAWLNSHAVNSIACFPWHRANPVPLL